MQSEGAPIRVRWAAAAASWLRRGALGAATAATAASFTRYRSSIRLSGHGGPILLQQYEGHSKPKETPRQQQVASEASSAFSPASEAQPAAAAVGSPRLHFCEETNEPEDICNAQWLVLWSYAAYAPDRPSEEEQHLLRSFFELFPDQCTDGLAANCYSEAVKASRPRVTNRRELLLWLCMVENHCRLKAGLQPKQCRHSELMRRWRYSDGYV